MRLEGIQPPNVTFLSLLRACSHVGLFERGMDYGVVGIHGERLRAKSKIRTLCLCLLGLVGLLNESKYFMNGLLKNLASIAWWL